MHENETDKSIHVQWTAVLYESQKRCSCSTCGASYGQLLWLVSYLMRIQVFLVVMLSSRILHSQHSFKLSGINNPATQYSNLKDQKPQTSQVTSSKYWVFCGNVVHDSVLLNMTSHHQVISFSNEHKASILNGLEIWQDSPTVPPK